METSLANKIENDTILFKVVTANGEPLSLEGRSRTEISIGDLSFVMNVLVSNDLPEGLFLIGNDILGPYDFSIESKSNSLWLKGSGRVEIHFGNKESFACNSVSSGIFPKQTKVRVEEHTGNTVPSYARKPDERYVISADAGGPPTRTDLANRSGSKDGSCASAGEDGAITTVIGAMTQSERARGVKSQTTLSEGQKPDKDPMGTNYQIDKEHKRELGIPTCRAGEGPEARENFNLPSLSTESTTDKRGIEPTDQLRGISKSNIEVFLWKGHRSRSEYSNRDSDCPNALADKNSLAETGGDEEFVETKCDSVRVEENPEKVIPTR